MQEYRVELIPEYDREVVSLIFGIVAEIENHARNQEKTTESMLRSNMNYFYEISGTKYYNPYLVEDTTENKEFSEELVGTDVIYVTGSQDIMKGEVTIVVIPNYKKKSKSFTWIYKIGRDIRKDSTRGVHLIFDRKL